MKDKIYLQGIVKATIKSKDGTILYENETNNTVVKLGQDHIADLLSRSFLLSQPHGTTAPYFVDYMSIGAGYKITQNSVIASELYLPRDPNGGSEPNDYYDGCVVHCVSGANQGDVRTVVAGGYDNSTRKITLDTPFSNVPLIGEVYTVTTTTDDIMLQGESTEDENGDTILNPKKPITMKFIKASPNVNEIEIRAERDESEGDFIVGEAGLRYDLSAGLPGNSSTGAVEGKLFSKGVFLGSVPHKTSNDILEIRWTIRVGAER